MILEFITVPSQHVTNAVPPLVGVCVLVGVFVAVCVGVCVLVGVFVAVWVSV